MQALILDFLEIFYIFTYYKLGFFFVSNLKLEDNLNFSYLKGWFDNIKVKILIYYKKK